MVFACKDTAVSNEKTFFYEYNNATGSNEEKNVTLHRDTFANVSLCVPEKEHFTFSGWYLDETFNTVVSDETGKVLIGREVFDGESSKLYAKWTVNEQLTYKILMVYVTDIEATLETYEGKKVNVNYKMSPLERRICEVITTQFEKYLTKALDGLVTFEIDSYFTTERVGRDSFTASDHYRGGNSYFKTHYLMAPDISEVSGKLKDYDGSVTTFGLNDNEHIVHLAAGYGGPRHASIHLESLLYGLEINDIRIETLLNVSNSEWNNIMSLYLHEFTHTIEQRLFLRDRVDELHMTEVEYHKEVGFSPIDNLNVLSLYLRNKATLNGETIGIPYQFWKGEYVDVAYSVSDGGYLQWELGYSSPYSVLQGTNIVVEAVAEPKYRFIGWSDGITTAERKDLNIQKDIIVTALFEIDPDYEY